VRDDDLHGVRVMPAGPWVACRSASGAVAPGGHLAHGGPKVGARQASDSRPTDRPATEAQFCGCLHT
jgi:hypothetical protein